MTTFLLMFAGWKFLRSWSGLWFEISKGPRHSPQWSPAHIVEPLTTVALHTQDAATFNLRRRQKSQNLRLLVRAGAA